MSQPGPCAVSTVALKQLHSDWGVDLPYTLLQLTRVAESWIDLQLSTEMIIQFYLFVFLGTKPVVQSYFSNCHDY